jgi:hypothetical protein
MKVGRLHTVVPIHACWADDRRLHTRAWPTAFERSYAEFGPYLHDWKGLEGGLVLLYWIISFSVLVVLTFSLEGLLVVMLYYFTAEITGVAWQTLLIGSLMVIWIVLSNYR